MRAIKLFQFFLITVFVSAFSRSEHVEVVTLFEDTFETADQGSIAGPSLAHYDIGDETEAYTNLYKIFHAGGAVKLGTDGESGIMTTTNLSVRPGTVTVMIDAIGYDTKERDFTVTIGADSKTLTCTDDRKSDPYAVDHFVTNFNVLGPEIQVEIASVKRVIVTNLFVTQTISLSTNKPVFSFELSTGTAVRELSEVAMTVSATLGGASIDVAYDGGLPEWASFTFDAGAFSWTPQLGDAGSYVLNFSAIGTDNQSHTFPVTVSVETYPLTAPVLSVTNVTARSFDIVWDEMLSATEGFEVSVWSGSGATNTPHADAEPFYAIADGGLVVAPYGWAFHDKVNDTYSNSKFVELKFEYDKEPSYVISKTYPKALTNVSFFLKGYSTKTNANSQLKVYASQSDERWNLVATYSSLSDDDGDDSNNIFTNIKGDLEKSISLNPFNDYRRLKFEYTKVSGNVGVGDFFVYYEGAGTKFVHGWKNTPVDATSVSVLNARPDRDYTIMVGAKNGVEIKTSVLGLRTLEALARTLMLIQ